MCVLNDKPGISYNTRVVYILTPKPGKTRVSSIKLLVKQPPSPLPSEREGGGSGKPKSATLGAKRTGPLPRTTALWGLYTGASAPAARQASEQALAVVPARGLAPGGCTRSPLLLRSGLSAPHLPPYTRVVGSRPSPIHSWVFLYHGIPVCQPVGSAGPASGRSSDVLRPPTGPGRSSAPL